MKTKPTIRQAFCAVTAGAFMLIAAAIWASVDAAEPADMSATASATTDIARLLAPEATREIAREVAGAIVREDEDSLLFVGAIAGWPADFVVLFEDEAVILMGASMLDPGLADRGLEHPYRCKMLYRQTLTALKAALGEPMSEGIVRDHPGSFMASSAFRLDSGLLLIHGLTKPEKKAPCEVAFSFGVTERLAEDDSSAAPALADGAEGVASIILLGFIACTLFFIVFARSIARKMSLSRD